MATVSGPAATIASSIACTQSSSVAGRPTAAVHSNVLGTRSTLSASIGRNGSRNAGNARQRQGAQGRAVVGPPAGHHLVAPLLAVGQVIAAGELQGRLHCLGSRVHKEHPIEVAPARQRRSSMPPCTAEGVRHSPIRVEGELVHLLGRSRGEVAAAVAEIGAEQAGESVQVPVSVRVPHVAALAAVDHDQVIATPSVPPRENAAADDGEPAPYPPTVYASCTAEPGPCPADRLETTTLM